MADEKHRLEYVTRNAQPANDFQAMVLRAALILAVMGGMAFFVMLMTALTFLRY